MALYSHSRISTFEQCPLKFKFSYIDQIKTEIEETVEAFLGKRVHEVFEKLYTDAKFQKIPTVEELLEFYNAEWKKNWNDAIVIVRKEYPQDNFRRMGEKFIKDYYKRYYPFNDTKTLALETQKTVSLDDEDKYQIHIRIDRLAMRNGTTYEIHDYKTANTLPTQEDIDNDRQLAIYAYGIKKMYPDATNIKLIWHYLAFDKELSSERSNEQIEELRQEVIDSIKEIETAKKYPAKESALCKWCQFRPVCPNFKHLADLEKTKKDANSYLNDDGVKLVNKYSEFTEKIKKDEAELEKIKEALILYAEENKITSVFGSDIRASIYSYDSLKFPGKNDESREKFVEVLKKIGLHEKLTSIDTYELAKMINNKEVHEELAKLLHEFIKKEKTYRIYLKNK